MDKNVLGETLAACCFSPLTGYFRDGSCRTAGADTGSHVLCAAITDAFLQYTLKRGNDLITPKPEWNFPGLKAGDFWCLCAVRWLEAEQAGVAPLLKLSGCHERALQFAPLSLYQAYAIKEDNSL